MDATGTTVGGMKGRLLRGIAGISLVIAGALSAGCECYCVAIAVAPSNTVVVESSESGGTRGGSIGGAKKVVPTGSCAFLQVPVGSLYPEEPTDTCNTR